jgi:hypothetical protein
MHMLFRVVDFRSNGVAELAQNRTHRVIGRMDQISGWMMLRRDRKNRWGAQRWHRTGCGRRLC